MDLTVQTALLRHAADVLDDASTAFGGNAPGDAARCPLTDEGLGRSAAAREVVESASRRVPQAVEATRRLGVLAADTAGKLRTVAAAFETAESAAIAPPR